MKFFFAIIIPVYNTEKYLPRCLDSVVLQSFGTDMVQVIVVNDGSPMSDECDKIIESYRDRLHIDYIKFQENQGLFLARKRGVEKVESSYFLHLDPDDYLEKKALNALYDDIQKNGDADYIEFNILQLRHGYFKFKYSFLLPRDAQTNAIDIFYNDGGHQTRIFNKCFNFSFAKSIYAKMPEDYLFFMEDFYQTCILDYLAKNRRILKKYLYVYVIGTGITSVQFCTKEKVKQIVLSAFNIEKNLVAFYQQYREEQYILQVKEHAFRLYLGTLDRSNLEDFVACCRELLDEATLERILLQHLGRISGSVKAANRRKGIGELFAKLKRYLNKRFRR